MRESIEPSAELSHVNIIFSLLCTAITVGLLGGPGTPDNYLLGISPEGIGTIGMFINFIIAIIVSRFTKPTPERIKQLVENIRYPK